MIVLIAFDENGRRLAYVRKQAQTRERSPKRFTWLLSDAMVFDDAAMAQECGQNQRWEAPLTFRAGERLSPAEARQQREAA